MFNSSNYDQQHYQQPLPLQSEPEHNNINNINNTNLSNISSFSQQSGSTHPPILQNLASQNFQGFANQNFQSFQQYHMYPKPEQTLKEEKHQLLPQQYHYVAQGSEPFDHTTKAMPQFQLPMNNHSYNGGYQQYSSPDLLRRQSINGLANPKFSENDVELLRQLLVVGERHKWKQITKEINIRLSQRRGEEIDDDDQSQLAKNVSPTYVIKQYQNLLGLPKNLVYFGVMGSSLPYVVAEKGWDDLADTPPLSEE